MAFRIAVDTGGTFTDVVVADEAGDLRIGKALTTRARAFDAIRGGLEPIAAELDTDVGGLLAQTDVFSYGTTRATNAIVEGLTARTALFTTEGFPDVLLLREGGKPDPFRQIPYPPPYVPRHLTWEIGERIDSDGGVHRPLDEASVLAAIAQARAEGCEAVAVCLLWAVVNGVHELRVGELIEEHWPGAPVTLSHQLNPIVREYRRASSAAIDASLKPLMQEHLSALDRDLRDAGFAGHLFVATSSGGSWRPDEVVQRPIYSVGSGPSLAPVAALTYARTDLGTENLIVCDTGGTTFDVGLVRDGEVSTTGETWLGGRWVGHITGIRSVDVKSIGAGGGSIAWIDAGGLLCVGPKSAGADPGPACYGRGGSEPTVTDAALVLGYLDPDYFLGGRLALDTLAARRALETRIGEPLGMSAEQAALATFVIATENIVGAIRELTIAQGIDPREVALVAGGGASGLNVVAIARELGVASVLVPSTAGALSACGALYADVVRDFAQSRYAETRALDHALVNEALAAVSARADAFLSDLADIEPEAARKEFAVDARYRSQVWELEVPLAGERFETDGDIRALEDGFHRVHERVFAVREEGQYLECLVWRCRATAVLSKPTLGAVRRAANATGASAGTAVFPEVGAVETARLDGPSLAPGTVLDGPVVVREPTTTVVVPPRARLTVTPLGNYLLETEVA